MNFGKPVQEKVHGFYDFTMRSRTWAKFWSAVRVMKTMKQFILDQSNHDLR